MDSLGSDRKKEPEGQKWQSRKVASWARVSRATPRRPPEWGPRGAQLGKGGASPSRCIPPEQRGFRAPRAPHDEGRSCPCDPTQPCAGWIRARAMPPWTGNQGALPPDTPASGFRARHHEPGRCRHGDPDPRFRAGPASAAGRRFTPLALHRRLPAMTNNPAAWLSRGGDGTAGCDLSARPAAAHEEGHERQRISASGSM